MYLDFYDLTKDPFRIAPDPDFFYMTPSHREALASVMYGVENRQGFILLYGEVGTGKTTVLRAYMQQVDSKTTDCYYLFDPDVNFQELLQLLLNEMGFEVEDRPASWMIHWLQWLLIKKDQTNRTVVLLIDEAQNMPMETLERLRTLSNLETPKNKLLQVVLCGQPQLNAKLEQRNLLELRQRIAIRATIKPLTHQESIEYLAYRIMLAGRELKDIFQPAAVNLMVTYAKGIPRVLNIVANNSLVAALGIQTRPVPAGIVREVIADLEGKTDGGIQTIKKRLRWWSRR